MVWLTNCISSI